MPGPYSYTREDVAELHLPGSPALLQAALQRMLSLGARAAGPGEFTRRAFQNGRIDLTRAEGVLELIRASNEGERRSAVRLLDGGLGSRGADMRTGLNGLRALCEASLDFDEADTGHVPQADLLERMDAIAGELSQAMAWESARQAPSSLPRVLLYGAPNAGKSSLYNALAPEGQDAALVSDLAGTTRDYLSRTWCLNSEGGLSVLLIDTPGLDRLAQGADASAQRLAQGQRRGADLILWVVNAQGAQLESLRLEAQGLPEGLPVFVLWNQIDRPGVSAKPPLVLASFLGQDGRPLIPSSSRSRAGLAQLSRLLEGQFTASGGRGAPQAPAGAARELFARHRAALGSAAEQLQRAKAELIQGLELDLVAETLRAATSALDEIQGSTTPEDLLDRIFASFCIGK